MLLDNFLGNSQPQTRSALCATACLIHSIKAIKNLRQVLLGNSQTFICNRENQLLIRCLDGNSNGSTIRRILDGIVHDIINHLGQLICINLYPNRCYRIITDNLIFLGLVLIFYLVKAIEDKGDKGREIRQLHFQMTGLIVNTGQTKQVRYHPHHAVGFIERYLDKVGCYRLRQGSLI